MVATSVERHAEAEFLLGNAITNVSLNGFANGDATREGRTEKRCVMLGWIGHVVSHDIDKVHVLDTGREIDILAIGDGGTGEEFVLAQHLTQVAHQ